MRFLALLGTAISISVVTAKAVTGGPTPAAAAPLSARQLVTPNTGSLVVTCGACSEMEAGHAPCFACEGSGAGTKCSDALSVPCGPLSDWLAGRSEAAAPAAPAPPPPSLDEVTILTCGACEDAAGSGSSSSQCTMCQGISCSDPYAVECDLNGDLGWGDLVGLGD